MTWGRLRAYFSAPRRGGGSAGPAAGRTSPRHLRLLFGALVLSQAALPAEPVVRIGIERNVSGFRLASADPFTVDGLEVREAVFSTFVVLENASGPVRREDLQYRMAIDLGDGGVLVRPMDARLRVTPGASPVRVEGRAYRGEFEIIGAARGVYTVVNELPLEDYLLGVVPNELGPDAFPELEALKAQAVAARTYIVRNRGQFAREGYDICATQQCQVYFGLDTEHPLATRAVAETRGMIATYDGAPINALYSSTCGGRTENSENVFGEAVPYLVSTLCHYDHPEPHPFLTSTLSASWEEGLLHLAGVADFRDAGRFLSLAVRDEPAAADPDALADFIRPRFYPEVPVESSRRFLEEQGVISPNGSNAIPDVLVRLLVRKNAFEWRDARLFQWDGRMMRVRLDGMVHELPLRPDAAIFRKVGDVRIPVREGVWMGGELMELRIVDDAVAAVVYTPVQGADAADRYSPVARWQARLSRAELDNAVRSLGVGGLQGVRILERGPSERVTRAEIVGASGRRQIDGPRFRTLFSLRDSAVYLDEERNAAGELLGIGFFGGGWGHGVGMCQVGAFGMAMNGATAEEILKTYYRGIEVEKVY